MLIYCTLSEILQYGDWEKFCKGKEVNEYAVNEGGGDIEVVLTPEEIVKYGLLWRFKDE